ncbi:MAG: short-chain dehydrogenase, partial [Polaribacter sp.]
MTRKKRKKTRKEKTKLMHSYYSRTGFYIFIWESLKKAIIPILLVVIGLILINSYVYNINDGLQSITETFSKVGILIFFF